MKLILVSGESLKNKAWIEQVRDSLKDKFEPQVLYYDHWHEEDGKINFETELGKLLQMTANITDFVLLAKSAGSWLTLQAVAQGKIKPAKFIIVGPAWDWAKNNGFVPEELMSQVTIPVLIVDKTLDPSLAFADLKRAVEKHRWPTVQIVEIAGDSHHYEDVAGLAVLVNEFIKSGS